MDAATAACSVALWREGEIIAWREAPMARGHAEALMPLVMETMATAGLAFAELDKIAVGVGPGSFTGIRIALAAARGIGLAAHRPVVGVDSFNAVASTISDPALAGRSLLVAIESKRHEIFGQYFDDHRTALSGPLVLEAAALLERRPAGALLVAGDGAGRLPLSAEMTRAEGAGRPDARAITRLAGEGQAILAPRPFYLRPPDVTLPGSTS